MNPRFLLVADKLPGSGNLRPSVEQAALTCSSQRHCDWSAFAWLAQPTLTLRLLTRVSDGLARHT
jgi:hypothetical protein